jgi:hypothetical protein
VLAGVILYVKKARLFLAVHNSMFVTTTCGGQKLLSGCTVVQHPRVHLKEFAAVWVWSLNSVANSKAYRNRQVPPVSRLRLKGERRINWSSTSNSDLHRQLPTNHSATQLHARHIPSTPQIDLLEILSSSALRQSDMHCTTSWLPRGA